MLLTAANGLASPKIGGKIHSLNGLGRCKTTGPGLGSTMTNHTHGD